MVRYGLFDIIGPVMIGPSSSHTAGAARLGFIAGKFLEGKLEKAVFYLHGSFAATGKGHGTDKALLSGVMGLLPDDARLPLAFEVARLNGISFEFISADLGDVHPNTVKIILESPSNRAEITGSSIGGGLVKIFDVNGIAVDISGEDRSLIVIHMDRVGTLSGVIGLLAAYGYNIASMQLFRKEHHGQAIMVINTDEMVMEEAREKISHLPNICKAFLLATEN